MKVGVDGSIFVSSLTGIGNYAYHLLRQAAVTAPRIQFEVLTHAPLCVEFPEQNIAVRFASARLSHNVYYWKLFGLAGAARRAEVDVFWAASGVAPFFMPCPVVLTVYDFVYKVSPGTMPLRARWFRRFSQPWWIHRACAVFTIAAAVDDEMQRFCNREAAAVVRPAADASFFRRSADEVSQIRREHGLGERYNLIVGTLEPRKNLSLFVTQYLAFQRDYPHMTLPPLALTGGKGWKDDAIVRVLEEGERMGRVVRLGYVPVAHLPALYSGAELFFMPSRYEGFGMPILEARKCGCPVVCSDVPAMREAGGEQALYHPPTAEGIRWALEELYLHGRLPISDAGRGVTWSWQSGAANLVRLLQDTAASLSRG